MSGYGENVLFCLDMSENDQSVQKRPKCLKTTKMSKKGDTPDCKKGTQSVRGVYSECTEKVLERY